MKQYTLCPRCDERGDRNIYQCQRCDFVGCWDKHGGGCWPRQEHCPKCDDYGHWRMIGYIGRGS